MSLFFSPKEVRDDPSAVHCTGICKVGFVLRNVLIVVAEFTQGMILPTANGVAAPQSTHQSKAKLDKTQVGAAKVLQPRET